jgi:cytochrome P450
MDADAKAKLTEEELYAQMRWVYKISSNSATYRLRIAIISVILFAGHETTANSITWALFEIARNPEIQTRLRAEIRKTEAIIYTRGDTEFTSADFDAMSYTTAVIQVREPQRVDTVGYCNPALPSQEVLRFHPVAYHSFRYATQDEVLPLSQPITKRSGEVIHELPVPKGTQILISIAAYNRSEVPHDTDTPFSRYPRL